MRNAGFRPRLPRPQTGLSHLAGEIRARYSISRGFGFPFLNWGTQSMMSWSGVKAQLHLKSFEWLPPSHGPQEEVQTR